MSVMGILRRSIACAVAVVLTTLVGVSSTFADAPWWHVTAGSRPSYLQAGVAKDEVQQIVTDPGARWQLLVGGTPVTHPFEIEGLFESAPYEGFGVTQATHENIQAALETVYGAGNVEVTGGPAGVAPLTITSIGEDSDKTVPPVDVVELIGKGEASILTAARPDGQLIVTAANLGDAPASGETMISAGLPAGLEAVSVNGLAGEEGEPGFDGPVNCSLNSLSCVFKGNLPAYHQIEERVGVIVKSAPTETAQASVTGGSAPSASVTHTIRLGSEPAPFGVEEYDLAPEEEGGAVDTQAGSHPFQLTTTLTLNQIVESNRKRGELPQPAELVKDLHFRLPPGLIGNPTPLPQCTLKNFLALKGAFEDACSPQTAVGVARITISDPEFLGLKTIPVPLFNLEPSVGEPARFGFIVDGVPVFQDTSVRTGGDYGVTVSVNNINQTAGFLKSEVTFWGVPADTRHDGERGWGCLDAALGLIEQHQPCNSTEPHNPPPFLVLPTSCTGSLHTEVDADSWLARESFLSFGSDPMPALDGCNRLPFSASISVAPDGQAASTPTGLTVGIHVPQEEALNANGLSPSEVRNTTVTLPAGVALNPAAGDGLQACTDVPEPGRPEGQIALNSPVGPWCPEASKVGTVEVKSPLLPNALVGAVYLAAQDANPFGSLVAMYLVFEDPVSGTLVKLAGEVKPDPVTGQLVSTFLNTPQLPFEDLKLHFFGGSRAPLGTPGLCGSYTTVGSIAPWSGNAPVEPSSTFQITSGPNNGPCESPLPFDPELTAGSTNIQAGAFTPFTTTMSRPDGNQNLQGIVLHMPPGVSGLLTGVKLCGEAQGNNGTCGPESLIGETIVSVGLGGNPFSVKGGRVYITGPYRGVPFGLSIVNPAKAGPYDLEKNTACDCVVVRAKIDVDPVTAALTISTDSTGPYKIPTILGGIPLEIQHVNVLISRPGFTFNPTNCSPMSITGSLLSTQGATQALSVPFQATNCATLAFKPQFKVSTAGKTSRRNGASLHVKLAYPKTAFGSQANIKSVKVDLPKQLPSRLTTLQKACTSAQFQANPAGCPAPSMVGHATATTPLIPVPLTGPAYFVSYGGAKFPELVIVLQGYGVTLDLHGETFINKAGITSSTFHTVPDAPVGNFELTLPQGPYSALAANGNLCRSTLKMPTLFVAQNGAMIKQSTRIGVTECPKAKKSRGKHRKGKR
jgi:hypothetical protein